MTPANRADDEPPMTRPSPSEKAGTNQTEDEHG